MWGLGSGQPWSDSPSICLESGYPAGLGTGNPISALGLVPSTVQGFVHIYNKAGWNASSGAEELDESARDRQVQCGVHLCTKKKTLKNYFSLLVFQII